MSVNEVRLIGNLGNDPEIRFLPSGGAVANFTVATSEKWKDKQSGQMQEKTEWSRCVAFDRGNYEMGKYIGESCRKGTKIYIEGSLETREWEKDGIKRYTTEIKVSKFEVLANGVDRDQQAPAQQAPAPQQTKPQPQSFGSWGKKEPAIADPWANYVPNPNNEKVATIEQIKAGYKGDLNAAIEKGHVVEAPQAPNFDDFDDDIPF